MPIINFSQPIYDADASAYFTTAGVTNTAGRQQISRFVTGVKDLGLWSSMVCWPFRSAQNPNAATTAYSLGGLGTFNATCLGSPSPVSGIDGITFNGTSNVFSTTFTSVGVNSFCAFAGTCPTTGGLGNIFGAGNTNSQNLYWLNPRTNYGAEYRFGTSNTNTADNTLTGNHFWLSRGVSGSPTRGYVDGTLVSTSGTSATTPSPLTLSSGLQIGRDAGGFGGVMAFAMVCIIDVSSPSSLGYLYKTTLGTGLGLP